jgi:hypothetical protein
MITHLLCGDLVDKVRDLENRIGRVRNLMMADFKALSDNRVANALISRYAAALVGNESWREMGEDKALRERLGLTPYLPLEQHRIPTEVVVAMMYVDAYAECYSSRPAGTRLACDERRRQDVLNRIVELCRKEKT